MAKHHWVQLPNREKVRIHMHGLLGAIIIAYEPASHPGQIHELVRIVPEGTIRKTRYFDYLKEHDFVKDHVESPHEFFYFGHRLRIEAVMEEYALFGFIPLPEWLVQSIVVTLWVDNARYWEVVF